MSPVPYLEAQLRIDQPHREADQARLARLARRHRRRAASRPAHQARSA
jgi:hypothetical protein